MREYISPNDEKLFGADDSATIQNAIAAAEQDGCRKIVIPRYNLRTDSTEWRIPRAIRIPSEFTVVLDNCFLVQETGVYEQVFMNSYADDETKRDVKYEQTNIAVIGKGNAVIDGGKLNNLREKTARRYGLPSIWQNTMFLWLNVNGLRIENLNIQNQRWWAITHLFCRNVKIRDINFFAIPHVFNMDGIDLRVGCNNFDIENITGRTGDDNIALTALWGAGEIERKIEGKDSDIHDVRIRSLKADPHKCYCLRLLTHDGNKIYNIDVDTILDTGDFATKTRSGSTLAFSSPIYYSKKPMGRGDLHHINAKNIYSRSQNTFYFNFSAEHINISNVHAFGDNINCFSVGYGSLEFYKGCHFEDVNFEHIFYGSEQKEICVSRVLEPEDYHGTVFNLIKTTGEIKMRDVHVDAVKTVFRITGGLKADVEGYECRDAYKEFAIDEDSTLTVNGEVKR